MLSSSPGLLALALFALQATADLSARANDIDPLLASEKDDCDWAGSFESYTDMNCYSSVHPLDLIPGYATRYGVFLGGTGQDPLTQCNDILTSVTKYCSLENQLYYNASACDVSNDLVSVTTLDGNKLDANGDWTPYTAQGLVMEFWMNPSNQSDNGNACVAEVVDWTTCAYVEITNGASCHDFDEAQNFTGDGDADGFDWGSEVPNPFRF
ncbi:hypothetical protein LTR17_018396 [Elasticomyces elasticus]|nr:hypothetical protein LTR17_018396 [Elasticomyces elasticus]